MAKVRVHYRPDGRIAITRPVPGCRKSLFQDGDLKIPLDYEEGIRRSLTFVEYLETEDEWYERCCSTAAVHQEGHPFEDKDHTELPPKHVIVPDGNGGEQRISLRNHWTGKPGEDFRFDPNLPDVHQAAVDAGVNSTRPDAP